MSKKLNSYFNENFLKYIKKQYDCPIWIYHENIIKSKISLLNKFDIIRFAQKACSNINILKIMLKYNVKIDAVSLGEIKRALTAGFKPDDIVFTADLFCEPSLLKEIIKFKITVNIGSIDMLHQLGVVAHPGHCIWLRINPGFGYGHSYKTNTGGENSKHGIWHDDLYLTIDIIKKYKFNLLGLHIHIGSGVNYKHLKKVCNTMVQKVYNFNQDITMISAGGGLSIPYKDKEKAVNVSNYFNLWNEARKKISQHFGHEIKLEIEPGRFLVAECGLLIAQVKITKYVGKYYFILIDVGFNDLVRPAMYSSYHHITVISYNDRLVDYKNTIPSIIAGPLCESGDVFTQIKNGKIKSRNLPKVNVGDYIVFHDTGAYGASMSSNYNSRPLIPEILIKANGTYKEIRKQQSINDLLSLEI